MEIKLNFETKGVMVDYTTLLKLFKESFKDMTYDFIKEFLDEITFESHYYMADKIKEGDFSFLEMIHNDEDVHLLKEKVEEELKLRGY
jgi:spore cortex formation protein SpoVR/YcgB (stage V sporulation)